MGNLWGKQVPLKDLIRQNKRMVNKAIRELDRERKRMEGEEKKLVNDIKKLAKAGQMGAVKIQAKELCVKSHEAMASALKSTTAAMIRMNQQFSMPGLQKIMMEFAKENEKAELTQEMMGDTMDDVMGEEGDEEEEDAIVNQVLDEIGVSFTDDVPEAPMGLKGEEQSDGQAAAEPEPAAADSAVSDLEARLNNLRRNP